MANRPPGKRTETLGASAERQERVLKAQAAILRAALPTGVQVSFGEGRRSADVAMALLKGDRDAVLALPPRFEDELEFDLHVVRSTFSREAFELLLVLMEPVVDQALRSPERRAALRSRLAQLAEDPEAASLLDVGDEAAPADAAPAAAGEASNAGAGEGAPSGDDAAPGQGAKHGS